MANRLDSRGSEIRRSLPLDTSDANQVAAFCLGLGYDRENVVNGLVARCNVDQLTAGRIVDHEMRKLNGGEHA